MNNRSRLLFLITEDWYFWSHRLDLARAAAQAGFDVSIATRVTNHGERVQREGFRLSPISLFRRSRNPFVELAAVLELPYRRVLVLASPCLAFLSRRGMTVILPQELHVAHLSSAAVGWQP